MGLLPGSYHVKTESLKYLDRYYGGTASRTGAKSLDLSPGEDVANIDFGLVPGGAVSGHITGESDGAGMQHVYVSILDVDGNFVRGAETDRRGSFYVGKLPEGSYYVQTSNNQGYADEYYEDVTEKGRATPLQVTAGAVRSGIDFSLRKNNPPD